MAEELGGEPRREAGCGVGAQLRAARERAGLTIAAAARKLLVGEQVLEALESERFETLGASIYVKSYLRRYADLLGEPVAPLYERLASGLLMPQPDLTRAPRAARPKAGFAGRILSALAVLVVVGLAWWGWSHWREVAAVPVVSRLVSPRLPAVPVARAAAVAARAAPEPVAPAPAPAVSPHAAAAPGAATARITLRFPAASWVAVIDAAGRSIYRGMVAAGARRSFEGRAPLHVVLGYASGVAVRIDGRPASIASYVGRDHAVSFDITAGGRVLPAPPGAGG
ncbi:MAG: helix-turn-helix domain-containing protein [Steroidobacteraceae bacterium]